MSSLLAALPNNDHTTRTVYNIQNKHNTRPHSNRKITFMKTQTHQWLIKLRKFALSE